MKGKELMRSLEKLLESSAAAHGGLCPGQVIGVRMAILGCRLIGLDNPGHDDQIKKLIVYVEMDRCAADAIAHVTGAKLGRRSLKFMDFGIMAATFVNLETEEAFRVISTEEARSLAPVYAPEVEGKTQQIEAYKRMPDNVLFRVQQVKVRINDFDLPGPPRYKASCSRCGQVVRDHREVVVAGVILCQPCAFGAYFKNIREINSLEISTGPNRDGVSATTDS
jgi:formylmethanofuran dehydrogenase subunit E